MNSFWYLEQKFKRGLVILFLGFTIALVSVFVSQPLLVVGIFIMISPILLWGSE